VETLQVAEEDLLGHFLTPIVQVGGKADQDLQTPGTQIPRTLLDHGPQIEMV
jgi:hypothetical protein